MFKDVLLKKNISIYLLAKRSGVSYTAINELYRGERTVEQCSGKTLELISKTLNMSMDELYKTSLKRESIPLKFKHYFWDTNYAKLDLDKDKIYIISRLLTSGGYEGYCYLNRVYNYEDFKYVAINSRELNPKAANFLLNNYHLKKENMRYYQKRINWREPCI